MTRRYFYTDPLAAAWMAKHFGMKFGIKHNGMIHWNCIGKINEPFEPLQRAEDILDPISEPLPLYIHPDSLHLLKPTVGDVVRTVAPTFDAVMYTLIKDDVGRYEDLTSEDWFAILERSGIAFMWPESEEV
jgi:hypothetical protein